MEINNGEINVNLPESLAKLLLRNDSWEEGSNIDADEPQVEAEPETLIPLSHVPGLIDGVSMREITRWVKDGTVPHTLKGRTKLVKLSDVTKAGKEIADG